MAVVISHRGARALAAENTLGSISAAAKCKADMVEVDVRLSKDGYLVLMHDETVDRTTNGKGKVEDLLLAELQSEEVMGKGKTVPTLREAAELAKELKLGLVVEMKEEGLEELVANELEGSDAMVTSFQTVAALEANDRSFGRRAQLAIDLE